ncbi:uncharacterized protein BDW43DRAFT_293615 [Aspergillus alliaceus]|uniref:uncharacterized protein n=1 Tax=Petromyces alliaceus TaxID=209559 RepID=UPI0012A76743|nr:uncharacterized protein BDW43DRAFT_293615 [Aspergillus alliaceus]KAB8227617.1 hypothetical protein BDW43DRAFT_293615 [Aspergillus alliaceus]
MRTLSIVYLSAVQPVAQQMPVTLKRFETIDRDQRTFQNEDGAFLYSCRRFAPGGREKRYMRRTTHPEAGVTRHDQCSLHQVSTWGSVKSFLWKLPH